MQAKAMICLTVAIFELHQIAAFVQAREPRVVFNDDAQMLMETPREGATAFVKARSEEHTSELQSQD